MTEKAPETAPVPSGDHQEDAPEHEHPLAQRIKKRAAVIFKDRRIYGRVRISTVALIVAFLAVLWLYLAVRPPPTLNDGPAQPASTSETDSGDQTTTPTSSPSGTTSETATPSVTPSETGSPGGRSDPQTTDQQSPGQQTTGERNVPAPPAQTAEPDASE